MLWYVRFKPRCAAPFCRKPWLTVRAQARRKLTPFACEPIAYSELILIFKPFCQMAKGATCEGSTKPLMASFELLAILASFLSFQVALKPRLHADVTAGRLNWTAPNKPPPNKPPTIATHSCPPRLPGPSNNHLEESAESLLSRD